MKLYINTYNRCTQSQRSEEAYGEWYESYDFRINSVHLDRTSDYDEEFDVPFEVVEGDEVYILYMIYTSGDSFGYSDGNSEIIWVFKDKEVARKAEGVYIDAVESEEYNNSLIEVVVDGGTTLKLSNPAWGYFENVSTIELETFKVEK